MGDERIFQWRLRFFRSDAQVLTAVFLFHHLAAQSWLAKGYQNPAFRFGTVA
jgi:hypothetical protein